MRFDTRQLLGVINALVVTTIAASCVFVAGAPNGNTLTANEKAAGWTLLFDGTTTSGWRGYQQKNAPAGWTVANGELTRSGNGGDLITANQYADFELSIDWKIAANGNSGIFYRGVEAQDAPIYQSAPEYQLLDNARHPDAKNGPDRTAGANYDLIAPSKDVCHPAGQWNSTRILVKGAHVEHWLNDVKVVEYELWTPEWRNLVANNKFKDWPTYGMAKSGHIALQDHGDQVAFKNVKIRVLK